MKVSLPAADATRADAAPGGHAPHFEPAAAAKAGPRVDLHTLTGMQILGTGSYLPDPIVTNADLAAEGLDPEWIVQRTGIHTRRRAPPEQATSDLAAEAGRRCLEAAGVDPREVDLLLVATMTPDSPSPSTACIVQKVLGIGAPAVDLNAACAGFLYGLVMGCQFIATGSMRRVLVIGAETMSRTVSARDPKTYPIFGDGAGAVLLGPGKPSQGLLSYTLGADGGGADLICIPGGGTREPLTAEGIANGRDRLHMDGRAVFKWAVRLIEDAVAAVLRHAGVRADELAWVVLHQANLRILDAAVADFGVPRERLAVNIDRVGNTSAASVPILLDELSRAGKIKPGDRLLLCGFGAGLAWGAAVIEW